MDRREYIAATATVSVLSGCLDNLVNTEVSPSTPETIETEPMARHGFPQNICQETVRDIGINEIVDPSFDDSWENLEIDNRYGDLPDEKIVIGVKRSGQARAYPLSILWYHEIVNDDFHGPLIVSYCPLCKSGIVAERRVENDATIFRVSGLLWKPEGISAEAAKFQDRVFGADRKSGKTDIKNNGNLVMVDDATDSYWSQLLAQAICGPRRGEKLGIIRSRVTQWGVWKNRHSDTDILLPPPISKTS